MTPARLNELRALCYAATEGPWISWNAVEQHEEIEPNVVYTDISRICELHLEGLGSWAQVDVNAEFIAAARTAIPELLDEIERLQRGANSLLKTFSHVHSAVGKEDGDDLCAECGLDLRNPIHKRLNKPTTTKGTK